MLSGQSIASCPPLSVGIGRQFSSMALVHTKVRNRLGRVTRKQSLSMYTDTSVKGRGP